MWMCLMSCEYKENICDEDDKNVELTLYIDVLLRMYKLLNQQISFVGGGDAWWLKCIYR